MRNKKIYYRLEIPEIVLWQRNGYGCGETGNWRGDGDGHGIGNGNEYGSVDVSGDGLGDGYGSFIIEEDQDEVTDEEG